MYSVISMKIPLLHIFFLLFIVDIFYVQNKAAWFLCIRLDMHIGTTTLLRMCKQIWLVDNLSDICLQCVCVCVCALQANILSIVLINYQDIKKYT